MHVTVALQYYVQGLHLYVFAVAGGDCGYKHCSKHVHSKHTVYFTFAASCARVACAQQPCCLLTADPDDEPPGNLSGAAVFSGVP